MRLAVENLEHRFPNGFKSGAPALDVPAFAAAPGTLSVLTGPSGSGKSTFLYVLSGLLKATRGKIVWDGSDLASWSEGARDAWRRAHAGFVFQNFHLIPEMTAVQNITVAAYFTKWSARAHRERAEELLHSFNVPIENRNVDSYSRGEQQRVALARALIFDPAVIFADEPTASLDAHSAEEIAGLLARLASDEGKTVIAVSHDSALIEKADVLTRLEHGRVVPAHEPEQAA